MSTPTISIIIGRDVRFYHAFITTAPPALDAPSTLTLYEASLNEVVGIAGDFTAPDASMGRRPARLVLVDGRELVWQRARYRNNDHLVSSVHPVLAGLTTLQQWLWKRLRAADKRTAPSSRTRVLS
jgi:hypothetical protein